MANVQSINASRRKRRTRVEPVVEQVSVARPERELVLEDLLAPGLRLRVWSLNHSLTPSRI